MQHNDRVEVAQGGSLADEASIRRFLIDRVAERSRVAPAEVDPDRPFEELGLTSRDALAIAGELEDLVDRSLPATLVWEYPTITLLAAELSGARAANAAATTTIAPRASTTDDFIAVVGLGCRFPGDVHGPAEYWRFLRENGDAIREVPEGRWDSFDDGSPEVADLLARTTRLGGFLDDIAGFDAEFFGITPREAAVMDPQQRMLLEVAWEALEHAGLAPASLRGRRTGVFVGISSPEYAYLSASDLSRIEPWTATGAALSIVANRLSYLLDLRGPSMIVDTACSSSLVATDLAVRSLRTGESDVALAGGVNLLLSPVGTVAFDQGGLTAAGGRCRAFDAAADGMIRAEGCGVVVLKRLGDAQRDGDRVLAVIRGSAVNSDGRSNGLMAPNPEAQEALLRDAYAAAGVDPHEVDYVEAHGTGTLLGDPIEARALGTVLGRDREADAPLLIGSSKSNLGHLESAAGAAGLIKAVLALVHRSIPASLHFTEPNPHIAFDDLRLRVVAEETPWPAVDRPARAGVSSFGFGGTSAHIVLEEAPSSVPGEDSGEPVRPSVARPVDTVLLSDVSTDRVREHAVHLADWLESQPVMAGTPLRDNTVADVAYTLARRYGRGRIRSAVVARNRAELLTGLRALGEGRPDPAVVAGLDAGAIGRPVWVFAGSGFQRPGMGRRLLAEEAAFAETIDDLDPLFIAESGLSLWDALESGQEFDGIAQAQPTMFGLQVGLARLWQSYGIEPGAVIGHSMGEIAAAVVTGALSMEDGVKVITRRARLLESLEGRGGMAMLGASSDEAATLADEYPDVHIAVFASPHQTVLTGDSGQLSEVVKRAEQDGLVARMVNVNVALHSPQIDPLLDPFRELIADVRGSTPSVPFYSTVLGSPRQAPAFDVEYWVANLRSPVRLSDAVAAAGEDGFGTFIEISAHPLVVHSVTETLKAHGAGSTLVIPTLRRAAKGEEADDTLTFHAQLATLQVNGHPVDLPAAGRLVDLPHAPWRHEHHWVEQRSKHRADEHPLLGAHVELPAEARHAWRADVGTRALPWLADQRVHGIAVLPAAAYAELALAAGSEALGADASALAVTGLRLERFLPLEEHTTVTTTLTAGNPSRVEMHAQTAAGAWIRLATATVTRPAATEGVADGADSTVIAAAERGSRHYRLHPEVFDQCLRALVDVVPEARASGATAWLPESIGAVRLHGPTHRGGHCQARLVRRDDDGWVGELRLVDDDGQTLLEAVDVTMRPVERGAVPAPLSQKLLEVVWTESELVSTVRPGGDADPTRWVVLGDTGDDAAAFVGELETAGQLVVRGDVLSDPEAAVRTALAGDSTVSGVVALLPAELTGERLVLAVTGLARALAAGPTQPRLWLVTRGAVAVRDGEAGEPDQAFLRSLARVLAFEHPALRATLVDLDGSAPLTSSAATLRAELLAGTADNEVAWRDGVRYAARLQAARLDDERPLPVVRPGGSYVITGGYGGLGLVVARRLAERGAGRVVLSGRSGPSEDAEKAINELREEDVEVEVILGDIAEPGVAERVVAAAREGGMTLRGVVHGAAGFDDRLVVDVSTEDLHRVWSPKVDGGRRLHEATVDAELDWWVVFSSAASLLGSPGQAAYAAANAWLDAFVDWRRAHGLPATTINWGAWSEVGVAADSQIQGLDPINPADGVEVLEALLAHNRVATGVLRFDPAMAVAAFPEIQEMPFFSVLVSETAVAVDDADWPGPEALRESDLEQARRMVTERMRARVAAVLGFETERLDPAVPLVDLGLDSLVAIRIKSTLEHDFALTVPASLLLQGASVDVLDEWVAAELGLGDAPEPVTADTSHVNGRRILAPRDASERLTLRVFEDVLSVRPVGVTESFFALGGQEHQAEQVVTQLEHELGRGLDRAEVFARPTAEHVASVIRVAEENAARTIVRPLLNGRTPIGRDPFFCAHPGGGTTGVYQQLASIVGRNRPFYGLERYDDAPSVEERAARYVQLIREKQPTGPYRVGGWSFGGILAYEIAQQLTAEGGEVALVALIDSALPKPIDDEQDATARRYSKFAEYLTETYGVSVPVAYEELVLLDTDAQFALMLDRAAPVLDLLSPAIRRHQITSYEDTRAQESYRPRPYAGRVVLYRATEVAPFAIQDGRYDHPDDTNGFGALCSHLEVVSVTAHHLNLLDPPAVHAISDHLGAVLAEEPTPAFGRRG